MTRAISLSGSLATSDPPQKDGSRYLPNDFLEGCHCPYCKRIKEEREAPSDLPGTDPSKFGLVDVERHMALKSSGINLAVFLDGKDVTDRCRLFNDETQQASLYDVDFAGGAYRRLPSTRTHGPVVIRRLD